MKKLAAAALTLSGLMPVGLASLILLSPADGLAALGVASASDDVARLATLFAAALLAAAAVQLQAAWWIAGDRTEGLALGRLVGLTLIADGVVMVAALSDPTFGLIDAAKGLVLLGLVLAAERGPRLASARA